MVSLKMMKELEKVNKYGLGGTIKIAYKAVKRKLKKEWYLKRILKKCPVNVFKEENKQADLKKVTLWKDVKFGMMGEKQKPAAG